MQYQVLITLVLWISGCTTEEGEGGQVGQPLLRCAAKWQGCVGTVGSLGIAGGTLSLTFSTSRSS